MPQVSSMDLSTDLGPFFTSSRAQRYAFDLLIFSILPTPLPVFPDARSRSACFFTSSPYALIFGFGVYLYLHALQYILWFPDTVNPFLCCPFSIPHFGHLISLLLISPLYHRGHPLGTPARRMHTCRSIVAMPVCIV